MPKGKGASTLNQGSSHRVSGSKNSGGHQHRNIKCSASRSRNEYKRVVNPCLNRSLSSNGASPKPSLRSSVDRAVRSEDSLIAMGHALPDCFEDNPYYQNISPFQRSLNKRERCLDSVREIARLPSDLFTKVVDSPVRPMVVETESGQSSVDTPSVDNSSTKVRNRWFNDSSLRELAAVPSISKQDISIYPSVSPVASRSYGTFFRPHAQQQNDQDMFSLPANYFVNPDDTVLAHSSLPAKRSLVDTDQNKIDRRYSLESLRELANLPSISKIGLNEDMRSPCRVHSPVEEDGSIFNMSEHRSKELPQQYYALDPAKAPVEFRNARRTLFFLAKPIQPNEKMLEPILLFGYPDEVSVRLGSTNAYAYLPKERPVISSESLIDINQVPLTFSPRVQEKDHK